MLFFCVPLAVAIGPIVPLGWHLAHPVAAIASVPSGYVPGQLAQASSNARSVETGITEGSWTMTNDDVRDGGESLFYLSVGASIVTTRPSDGPNEEIDFDEGWGLQAAFGRRVFGSPADTVMLDLEVEGLYTDQESDDDGANRPIDDLNTAGVLVNGLAAFQVAGETELFAGAGLGVAWLDVGTQSDSLSSFDDEDGPFLAWQLRTGIRFAVGETTAIEVGYRFLNIDDAEVDDGIGDSDFELETQQHSLGVNVRFGR